VSVLNLAILLAAVTVQGEGNGLSRPQAAATRGPHFVGQEIGLSVHVFSGAGRPAIVPPRIQGGKLVEAGTDVEPISTSAIGDVVNEYNKYIFRYVLIVDRPGPFVVPPFGLRQGSRSTSTPSVVLTIRPIPTNRPRTFGGSVGPIEVRVEATPATIRLGQTIEYRVTVTGPGARGVRQPPDLERIKRLPISPTVSLLAVEQVENPPKRYFRFSIRPTKPGDATLPPLVLSWFDPRTGQFPVALSQAVPVRVTSTSREALLNDLPSTSPPKRRLVPLAVPPGFLALAILAAWWRWRKRRDARFRSARWCRDAALKFATVADDRDIPREITETLAEFLHLAAARPPGALTPEEARAGIAEVTTDPELADEAARLIRECDALRYDRTWTDQATSRLGERASRFFASLGRKHRERHSRPPH
jgi:hypothetical protein